MTNNTIPDIQSTHDPRNMVIARVGIKDVRFPMLVNLGAGAQASITVPGCGGSRRPRR